MVSSGRYSTVRPNIIWLSTFLHKNAYEALSGNIRLELLALKATRSEKGDDSDTYSIIFKALKHPIRGNVTSPFGGLVIEHCNKPFGL